MPNIEIKLDLGIKNPLTWGLTIILFAIGIWILSCAGCEFENSTTENSHTTRPAAIGQNIPITVRDGQTTKRGEIRCANDPYPTTWVEIITDKPAPTTQSATEPKAEFLNPR